VKADAETRGQVLELVQLFEAKVVDVGPTRSPIEPRPATPTSSTTSRCSSPFGIRELVQSGMVAIGRGPLDHRARSPAARTPPAPATADAPGTTANQPKESPRGEMFYDDDADLSLIQGARWPSSATAARATPTR
jgi:hypothetical protein